MSAMARRVFNRTVSVDAVGRRLKAWPAMSWRYVTADFRPLPDFVILGTQRGGTTSLYQWLSSHPGVAPALKKEVHYFDFFYDRGIRWYRSNFPYRRRGRITGEASPYMLFHPLAPERAAKDLPERTRFIVLLREPVQRAISNYWYWKKINYGETESFERAIALEPERMAVENERALRGENSIGHVTYSYMARGEYATQLRRWFDAVGRDRILILESEQIYADPLTLTRVLDWLGLPPHHVPYRSDNSADRQDDMSPALLDQLHEHFEPHNRELFELLGYELWADEPPPL
jgi:hypothetical protein